MGKRGPKPIEFTAQFAIVYEPLPKALEPAWWAAMDALWGEACRRVAARKAAEAQAAEAETGNDAAQAGDEVNRPAMAAL
jgi:hypothetical protein